MFLLTTLGLTAVVLRDFVSAPGATEPRVNLVIAELTPEGDGTRGEPTILRLPASADGAVLTLALVDLRDFPGLSSRSSMAGSRCGAPPSCGALRTASSRSRSRPASCRPACCRRSPSR